MLIMVASFACSPYNILDKNQQVICEQQNHV